jgi:hypothetical protein
MSTAGLSSRSMPQMLWVSHHLMGPFRGDSDWSPSMCKAPAQIESGIHCENQREASGGHSAPLNGTLSWFLVSCFWCSIVSAYTKVKYWHKWVNEKHFFPNQQFQGNILSELPVQVNCCCGKIPKTINLKKYLFWLMVAEVSVHGCLALLLWTCGRSLSGGLFTSWGGMGGTERQTDRHSDSESQYPLQRHILNDLTTVSFH